MSLFYKTTRTLLIHFQPLLLALFFGLATLPALAQTTWTGTTNTDWNTAGNWSAGVPTTTLDAIIPNVTPSPTIGASTSAVAKSVEVQSGGTLTIASSATLTINDSKTATDGYFAFLNEGDVQNSGQLLIGNLNTAGSYGIRNKATFSNKAGGTIQIDRTYGYALYNNSGTFTNAGTITIGSITPTVVGSYGLYNAATFNNNTGGRIQIDRGQGSSLNNVSGGTFNNAATIVLGSMASGGNSCLSNAATFYNNAGGTIQIDRADNSGLSNETGGTFTNSATITIGGTTGTNYGIINQATFNNDAGSIQIDRSRSNGLYNISGTFNNAAQITFGANAALGTNGIDNRATFNNNIGGTIQIDRATSEGISNSGSATFTNAATIKIGSLAAVGQSGILTMGTFNNNAGGSIQIDRTTTNGISNNGPFTNAATITIGSLAEVGQFGIFTSNTFKNEAGGNIQIDRVTNSGLYNSGTVINEGLMNIGALMATYGSIYNANTINNTCGGVITTQNTITISNSTTFTNSGSIIDKASGNSSISSNTGLVQNLNGGNFTITTNSGTLTTAEGTFWTGCTSTNWATASNWSGGVVPTTADDVVILSGTANQPTIGGGTSAVAKSVEVQSGATLTIASSGTLAINDYKFASTTIPVSFYNQGTVQNGGQLLIGNTGRINGSGIYNRAMFNNNAGGTIQIDQTNSIGLVNKEGTFTNAATIRIGSLAGLGNHGLKNDGTFNNNTGATIEIDRVNGDGMNSEGIFTNNGAIIIGAIGGVYGDGISNQGNFTNNEGGRIQIDRTSNNGLANVSTFTNFSTITIGASGMIGRSGLVNNATFNNNAGGFIQIDRTDSYGIDNAAGTFTNSATITIGASGDTEIYNRSTINNNGCGAIITTQKRITNLGTFTNSGTLIENSSRDSGISSNSGLVRNLNGGAFTITTNTGVLTTTDGTAAPTITATPSLTVNQGEIVTLTAEGATSYHWSTGETTPAISVTAAGPYSVTGTIGECSQVASVTLIVNAVTDVTVTNPAAVCAPATVDLTQGVASSSIPNSTFYFYTDADGTQEVPNPAAVGGGTYYVKATSQVGGASSLKSITVVVNTSPTVSISPNNPTICSGQSTTLTASGANTYLWSTGATSSTISVSSAGVVSVTGTSNGCSATATQTVTENALPTPTLTTNVSASSPGSATVIQNTPFVTLTASGCSGTLAWTGPNNPTGSPIAVLTSATGTLSYTVSCQQDGCSSPPASFTVYVTAPTTTGSFDGFVNGADCGTFRGWAWDRNKPNTVVSVEILDGSTIIGTLPAGDFRQDLLDAGKGNGRHAFRFTIPESVKDGLAHSLSARVAGSSFILKDSPKAIICVGTAPEGNKPPQPPTPTVLNAPLTAQVGVPFSGTLVAFTDPEGTTMSYGLSGLPTGLSLNPVSRVISGTPTEAGTFVLTYSATDEGGANNSVSFNLTINPAETTTVTGNFEGYLDKVECGTIRGWVWDRNKPNTPVTVEFYTGNTVWGSVVANIYRVDLKNAGKGNGAHAYSFDVPAVLKDGTSRLIYGRVQGSTFVLKDSGKPLSCNVPTRLSAETAPDLQVMVLGNPVLGTALSVEIRGAEGQPLRLELTDLQGRMLSTRQIDSAQTVERQTFVVQHQPPGLLLLRVTNGLKSVTVKVLR
ncbi:hypothetical protein [Larkinella punicea]|uniref:Dystroglycan-type cadherin-like domain-containing protein n=1 Tax=Larkinella punicea TaxID=2315727 RepID=A0A368JP04_9BACT|nr:hypothetical protein [Larkinella punicea]RCR67901.1 hypothetical protein DUE52_19445 [Larkinella punicea]